MAKQRSNRTRVRRVDDFDVSINNVQSGEIALVLSQYENGDMARRVTVQLDRFTSGQIGRAILRTTRAWAKAAVEEAERNP